MMGEEEGARGKEEKFLGVFCKYAREEKFSISV